MEDRNHTVVGLFLLGILWITWGCAASPFEAFVVSTGSETLTVLNFDEDRDLLEVEDSPFDVGSGACDVTYDARHRRVYVVNRGEDTLSVFKMKRISESFFRDRYVLEQMDRIDTGHEPVAVAVDSRQNLVLLLHRDGTLLRFNGRDLSSKDERNILANVSLGPEAVDLTYDARNDLIYVIDEAMDGLLVLEGLSLAPVHFASTPPRPCKLCYDDVNGRIYLTYRGDEINQEPPGLAVFKAGAFCNPIRDPIPLGVPYRCPDVAYDGTHNRIFVNKPNLRVYDGASFELMDEIQTSLPYALDTGLVDGASPLLLYIGQPESIRIHEIQAGDNHPYAAQVPLPGRGDRIAAVRSRCPEILSIEPAEGKVGDTVTILGLNFGVEQGQSIVAFGEGTASVDDVISWEDTRIEVNVPALARTGPVRVVVGNGSSAPPDGENVKAFQVIPGQTIHVSARDGSPGGDGSEARPYRTITHGLSRARPSDILYVHAGRYDRELGERFPLEIGGGVRVEGYGAGYDMPAYSFKILYSAPGDGAVEMGRGSSLVRVGVYVEDPESDYGDSATGILCRKTARIEDVIVAGFGTGIELDGGPQGEIQPLVTKASISDCGTGIRVCGSVNGEIVDNHLFENQTGIDMAGNTNRVVSNDLDDNIEMGIKIQGQAALISSNWVARTRSPGAVPDGRGLWGGSQTHTFVRGNMVYGNDHGMDIGTYPGYRHLLRDNTIEGNRRNGFYLFGDGSCGIVSNEFRNNGSSGILLRARETYLKDNNISYNQDGLLIHSVNELEALLEDNTLYGNTGSGIAVYGETGGMPQDVLVRVGRHDGPGNTISNNEKGIYVRDARAFISNNALEGNQTGVVASENGLVSLGSAEYPGGNKIQNSALVGLANQSNRQIKAGGNTWNASVQGADSEGHYPAVLVEGPVAPQEGNNYSISTQYGKIAF